jgi:hypothetical protein
MHREVAKYAIPFAFGRIPHPSRELELQAATCVALDLIVRPDIWPTPTIRLGEGILFVGYPKSLRIVMSWRDVDFRADTKLALVHELRRDRFTCLMDPAFVDRHRVGVEDVPDDSDLPGFSGGPGFLVRQDETILTPRLCSIVSQGVNFGGGAQLITLIPLDIVQVDGTIARFSG